MLQQSGTAEQFWVVRQVRGSGDRSPPVESRGEARRSMGADPPPKKLKHFVTDRPTLNSEANCKKKLGKWSYSIFCCFLFNLPQRWHFNYNAKSGMRIQWTGVPLQCQMSYRLRRHWQQLLWEIFLRHNKNLVRGHLLSEMCCIVGCFVIGASCTNRLSYLCLHV